MDNNTVLKLIKMLNRKITKYSDKVNMIQFIPSDAAVYKLVQSPEEDSDYNSDYDSKTEDMEDSDYNSDYDSKTEDMDEIMDKISKY